MMGTSIQAKQISKRWAEPYSYGMAALRIILIVLLILLISAILACGEHSPVSTKVRTEGWYTQNDGWVETDSCVTAEGRYWRMDKGNEYRWYFTSNNHPTRYLKTTEAVPCRTN